MNKGTLKSRMTRGILTFLVVFVVLFLFLRNTSILNNTLFDKEKTSYTPYFYDDFSNYEENSEVLDNSPENLNNWQNGGVITAWAYVNDWTQIGSLDLKLTDSSGKEITLKGIDNVQSPRENNKLKSNDEFADYSFNCSQPLNKWEDFMLINGKNFLFWEFNSLDIDMSDITSWKVYNGNTEVEAFDFVAHDGLCRDKNSLNGNWYSPNGLPQYGVWWTQDGNLILKNVEQVQYPSNGDHVRILSEKTTPDNFILRTRFEVTNLKEKPLIYRLLGLPGKADNKNTYIRIGWDFDNEYDPGHDQTLLYNSFEYGYLGLQRVYPIERYFVQGFEPEQSNKDAKTKFSFENNKRYEVDIKVQDKTVEAEVYELGFLYSRKVASLSYEFEKNRPEKEYPISIETTGDVEMILEDIEVWKLKETEALQ